MSLNIAIIGGGPTGVYALQALIAAPEPCFITLFERSGMAGVGMPYSPQFATVNMLANIGSIEIPPLTETYLAWLQHQPGSFLAPYDVDGTAISDRGFYPRILLGMYFRDQLERLMIEGCARGHQIVIREHQNVLDLAADGQDVRLTVAGRDGEAQLSFDRAIIASGHDWGGSHLPDGVVLPNPWTGLIDASQIGPEIAIIGTSLSGIDAVVAVAGRIGTFDRTPEGLAFTRQPRDREHGLRGSSEGRHEASKHASRMNLSCCMNRRLRERHDHLLPSIHFDIRPLSRKHSSGTARRLIRASFSAKATCLELGRGSLSAAGVTKTLLQTRTRRRSSAADMPTRSSTGSTTCSPT